jgi:hypothetical protein
VRRRRLTWLAALTCLSCCVAPAQAAFGPFTLVSGSPALRLQADYAYDAAMASDGDYVAYTGSIASVPGIYRTDLATGQTELVARGPDTGAPSISSNGQYISFTTDDNPLTGEATGRCSAVYVRNMNEELPEAREKLEGSFSEDPDYGSPAITLVSARNGSTESLTYPTPVAQSRACGSAAAYRVAIGDDGQEVAFTVLSPSDLTGQPKQTETPADQVAVRFLKEKRTELVSVTRASLGGPEEPVPGGAALAGPSILGGAVQPAGSPPPTSASTAAISADGNTVAWMGIDVQEQTDLATPPPTGGRANGFAEPLWRRIGEGATAPTRSVLAGGDASAPLCPPSCPGGLDLLFNEGVETTDTAGPIYGSFLSSQGFAATGSGMDPLDVITPQLSEDGNTVALLSTQPNYGEDPKYPPGVGTTPPTANAFVVNMTPGLTRAQSITRLTAWATLELTRTALAGPIDGITISSDGARVAFITERIAFPLAPPALVTPPLSQAANNELYMVDLPAGTMRLASEGYDGQPADASVFDASMNADGSRIALASAAANLAYGTANEGADVFVTRELLSPPGPGQQIVGPLPADPSPTPPWRISVTCSHGKNGALLLDVSVPGAGALTASASAAVQGAGKSGRGAGGSRTRSRKAGRVERRGAVLTRLVARAALRVKRAGIVKLTLAPAQAYGSLVRGRGGLYADIKVVFNATHRPPLTQTLQASFLASAPRHRAKHSSIHATAHDPARGR